MMQLTEIKRTLEEMLNRALSEGRKRNIVFWYDDAGEFMDEVDELTFSDAKVVKLTGKNNFQVKYIIERQDQAGNYIIYAPFGKPLPKENYLLDILKYSCEFSTDKATAIMRELNVTDPSLRDCFCKYLKFFNNKDRYRAFQSYALTSYTEHSLDVAVLSVLCKLPCPDFEEVLKVLLSEYADSKTAIYDSIKKFGDIQSFWNLAGRHYGYDLKQQDMDTLSIFLLVTAFSFSFGGELPRQWEAFASTKRNNVVVFINHFMGDGDYRKSYELLSDMVGQKIKLSDCLGKWEIDNYKDSDIFSAFDEMIIQAILDNILSDAGDFESYKATVLDRRSKHWFKKYENEYNALYWACVLLDEWDRRIDSLKEFSPYDFFQKYVEGYYQIDTAYRKFIYFFDRAANKEWFASLREKIENTYTNSYLNALSIKWSGSIASLRECWGIAAMPSQWNFFKDQIRLLLEQGKRVFVIVSDGLRYEAAREFAEILNAESRGSTEITAMQGVLPSYTKLGMASLLPHKKIDINSDYEVSVDGNSIEGLANRNKILNTYAEKSIAVHYKDIIDLKNDDFRKILSGKDLVYIYHNCIDARGDHYPTERDVFDAVEETFGQLRNLINALVNRISATNIYVVSDHGFIYKRGNIVPNEKTAKDKLDDAYENRRFILTDQEKDIDGTLTFDMKYLLGNETSIQCLTPKGVNRFEIKGPGANYVHGGSSLQEIVIPVIRFKSGGKAAKEVQKATIVLTSLTRKITNTITYLEFLQKEKVGAKLLPCRFKLYLADEDGGRISNENIIIADSKSDDIQERKFREKFILKNMKYDKGKKYFLTIEDEEETVATVYERISFTVDLAIGNDDFGF